MLYEEGGHGVDLFDCRCRTTYVVILGPEEMQYRVLSPLLSASRLPVQDVCSSTTYSLCIMVKFEFGWQLKVRCCRDIVPLDPNCMRLCPFLYLSSLVVMWQWRTRYALSSNWQSYKDYRKSGYFDERIRDGERPPYLSCVMKHLLTL